MKVTKRKLAPLGLGGALLLVGVAAARAQMPGGQAGPYERPTQPAPPPPPKTAPAPEARDIETEIVMTHGTVQSIDRERRLLVLKDESGDQIKVEVPPELPAFDKVRKGQRIDLTYYESIGVAVQKPGAAPPSEEARVRVLPAQQGGFVGQEVVVAAQVVNLDAKNRTVLLRLPSGQTQRISVADPGLQRQLRDIKPGQLVTMTYTEAVAASIAPTGAGQGPASPRR
jgi:hypothetical protein